GLCYAQVTVYVERTDGSRMIFGDLTPGSATALLDAISGRDVSSLRPLAVWPHAAADHFAGPGAPFLAGQTRLITRDLGQIDPESIDSYLTRGGYATLARALDSASQEDAIAEVKASGLIGRGGAYFPTAVKWLGCRAAAGEPKWLVVNAEEGEPGVFKDRHLL